MDAGLIRSPRPALDRRLKRFRPCFKRAPTFGHFVCYLLGLMPDLQRKSIEPIVLAARCFGKQPFVKDHFELIILAIIVLSVVPAVWEFLRAPPRGQTRPHPSPCQGEGRVRVKAPNPPAFLAHMLIPMACGFANPTPLLHTGAMLRSFFITRWTAVLGLHLSSSTAFSGSTCHWLASMCSARVMAFPMPLNTAST